MTKRKGRCLIPQNAAAHYGLAERIEFYKWNRTGALQECHVAYFVMYAASSPECDDKLSAGHFMVEAANLHC